MVYKWLRPDFVTPARILVCSPEASSSGSGLLVEPTLIDAISVKFGCFISRGMVGLLFPNGVSLLCGRFLPQAEFLDFLVLTSEELDEVALAKKSTAGGLDRWAWNETKALSLSWLVGLALVLRRIEALGRWPQGRLDAYIAMIPLCVLLVGYRTVFGQVRPSPAAGIPGFPLLYFHIFVGNVVKPFDIME